MGEAYKYQGNSFESLSAAVNEGVHGVEMDVRMSSDSVLVLYHHNLLEEGTGCNGKVPDVPWRDLQNCTYKGLPEHPKLISLSSFINSEVGQRANFFVLDLKQNDSSGDYSELFGSVIVKTLNESGLAKKCLAESSDYYLLRYLNKHLPALRLYVYCDDVASALEMNALVHLTGVTIDMEKVSASDIEVLHDHGLRVSLFNARTERLNSDAMMLSPDYIQTDRISYLMTILNKD